MEPSLIDDIGSLVEPNDSTSVHHAIEEVDHHFPNHEDTPSIRSPKQDAPPDNLLCRLDTDDLTSMRRVMIELDDRFNLYVLRPSDLKGEEAIFVNKLFASIRMHREKCAMLLWATYVFAQHRYCDDSAIIRAISQYQNLGSERVLLSSSVYPDEHAKLEAKYLTGYGSAYKRLSLSDWKILTPTIFESAQMISTKRAVQLDRIARQTNRDIKDIPREEALGLLPQRTLLGVGNLQTFNTGPCDDCRRRGKYCNKVEPFCQECRRTWNECCSYSTPSAGTLQDIEYIRKAMHTQKRAKLSEKWPGNTHIDEQKATEEACSYAEKTGQRGSHIISSNFEGIGCNSSNTIMVNSRQFVQSIEEDSMSPRLDRSGDEQSALHSKSHPTRTRRVTIPTHSSHGIEYASIMTPFDQDYPYESSLSPKPRRLFNPFPQSEFSELNNDHRSKSTVPSGRKRRIARETEEQRNSEASASPTPALTLGTEQTPTTSIVEETFASENDNDNGEENENTIVAQEREFSPFLNVPGSSKLSRRGAVNRDWGIPHGQATARGRNMNIGTRQITPNYGITKPSYETQISNRLTHSKANNLSVSSIDTVGDESENDDGDVYIEGPGKEQKKPNRPTRASARIASLQVTPPNSSHRKRKQLSAYQDYDEGIAHPHTRFVGNLSQDANPHSSFTHSPTQNLFSATNLSSNFPYLQSTNRSKIYQSPYASNLDGKDLYSVQPPHVEPGIQYSTQQGGTQGPAECRHEDERSQSGHE